MRQQLAFPLVSASDQPVTLADFSDKRVFVGLPGGINSAAVLCHLATEYPADLRPRHLFLYYAHLREHSPGTLRFVRDCVAYAKRFFSVTLGAHSASVIRYFESERFIPFRSLSPCTEHLKLIPMYRFQAEHDTEIDLVGYVRDERRRITRQRAKGVEGKMYPIEHFSNEYCLDLVKREIGWYPPIYDITDEAGKRVFKHNNCLPCKNWRDGHMDGVSASGPFVTLREHYPAHFADARRLSAKIGSYWGDKSGSTDEAGCSSVCEF